MRNTLLPIVRVKNVYSLGIRWGERCGFLPTSLDIQPTILLTTRVQPSYNPQVFGSFTPYLYTLIIAFLHLLIPYLYTVSTAPIITKTKEKKGNK